MSQSPVEVAKPVQKILITAAASGIGRSIAEAFLADGCKVHICDLDQTAIDDCLASNPGLSATLADVSNHKMVEHVFEDVKSNLGGLDVLVNNAGISGPVAAVQNIEPEQWERTIAVNLNSHFYSARKAVPLLQDSGGGSIIMIASTAAFFGCPLRSPYAASKWGLIGLTKTMAMELGPSGIRVNAICPGSVEGERIDRVMRHDAATQNKTFEEIRESYLAQNSMHTFVEAKDVVNMVLFLTSASGAKISGQAIGLDGNTESFSL
ncbi:MAG: NAD(P)-dependent dehydrogenase (short-subunit alcohol dehydrogenase family) [Lysobacterales bacterium]|jgi:NAD(P)-dependent dehydrogenase (short-subunit alcohol dehydrogenase family)